MQIINFLAYFPALIIGVLIAYKFENYFFGIKSFQKYNALILWTIAIGIFSLTIILSIVLLFFWTWLFSVCGTHDNVQNCYI